MKEIFKTLYDILDSADFYYPMMDSDNRNAMYRFFEKRRKYYELCESEELTEEEKEDFKNFWEYKENYSTASMRRNKEESKEYADKYNAIYDKYFE